MSLSHLVVITFGWNTAALHLAALQRLTGGSGGTKRLPGYTLCTKVLEKWPSVCVCVFVLRTVWLYDTSAQITWTAFPLSCNNPECHCAFVCSQKKKKKERPGERKTKKNKTAAAHLLVSTFMLEKTTTKQNRKITRFTAWRWELSFVSEILDFSLWIGLKTHRKEMRSDTELGWRE